MTSIPKIWFLALAVALGGPGCGGDRAPSTAPSTLQSMSAPRPSPGGISEYTWDVTLSGMFYEVTPSGRTPIEGVEWYSNDESERGHGTTGIDGLFSVKPVWVCPCAWAPMVKANTTSVYWRKAGYADPPMQPDSQLYPGLGPGAGSRDVSVTGDTRLEIELVREWDAGLRPR